MATNPSKWRRPERNFAWIAVLFEFVFLYRKALSKELTYSACPEVLLRQGINNFELYIACSCLSVNSMSIEKIINKQTGASLLRPKNLSEFPVLDDMASLMSYDKDGVYFYSKNNCGASESNVYLNDAGNGKPYILKLHNAKLIPISHLKKERPEGVAKLPCKLMHNRSANLLLGCGDNVLPDSIFRYRFVPEDFAYLTNGNWQAVLPDNYARISEPCFYLDLVCGHFGHALVDTPARLWPLLEEAGLKLKDLLFVGFRTHNIRPNHETWPQWLKQMLMAYGIDSPERIRIVHTPTICSSLLVPKRISPHHSESGPEYDNVMRIAGNRLLSRSSEVVEFGRKIFLSRSRVENKNRGLVDETEKMLDKLFEGLGYQVVHPQELDLSEQVAAIRGASHVAGCVGSQMHLTAFGDQVGLKVLRIAPSFFARSTDKKILQFKGGVLTDYIVDCLLEPGKGPATSSWGVAERELSSIRDFVLRWESE